MAIKEKKEQTEFVELPKELDALVHKAFTEQFMSSKFGDLFKGTKVEVMTQIKESDDITITRSESMRTKYGLIVLPAPTVTHEVNNDLLFDYLESQPKEKILAIIARAVKKFDADALKGEIGREKFEELSEKKTSESSGGRWTASPDFKAKCDAEFSGDAKPAPAPKAAAPKAEKKVKAKPDAKAEAAKALAAKLKKSKPTVAVEDDLDAILGGE